MPGAADRPPAQAAPSQAVHQNLATGPKQILPQISQLCAAVNCILQLYQNFIEKLQYWNFIPLWEWMWQEDIKYPNFVGKD